MKENSIEILVIGAFDRNNYGDLLFPFIIEHQFRLLLPDAKLSFYGIVESDLSGIGAKPTQSLKEFYNKCNNGGSDHTVVIVGGGETLAASWSMLYSFINRTFSLVVRALNKLKLTIELNKVARILLTGKTQLPFTFDKTDFMRVNSVIGNSLGGNGFDEFFSNKYKNATERLSGIDYLAVREKRTHQLLSNKGISSYIVPDSAILISTIFDTSCLQGKVKPEILKFVELNKYVFFQIKNSVYKRFESIVLSELEKIQKQSGITVCLCPIGQAFLHDDHLALDRINKELSGNHILFQNVSIYDIMYLIANTECYVGTSLHGAITAMSYSRPYIGFNKEIVKLDSYLKQWAIEPLNSCANVIELASSVVQAINVDRELIREKTMDQIHLVHESFHKMRDIIQGQK